MTASIARQQCWIHTQREAVCRCLDCEHFYCRECVSEHEGRLLCAACIHRLATRLASPAKTSRIPWVPVAALLGILISWTVFFVFAQAALEISSRAGEAQWRTR
jgi:hypothetical protein